MRTAYALAVAYGDTAVRCLVHLVGGQNDVSLST